MASRRRPSRLLIGLTGTLMLAASAPATQGETARPTEYVVKSGDTCLGIVKRLGGSVDLEEIHRLNPDVYTTTPPHHLRPGTVLLLTDAPSNPDATLTFVRPRVETRKPRAPTWSPGRVGQDLYRLYRVSTQNGATTEVTFIDHSQIQLREESLLIIYGRTRSRVKVNRRSGVELVQGSLRGGLAALRGEEDKLEVKTPAAKVTVASRDINLSVDKKKTTRVSVYDGTAEVAAKGTKVKVKRGEGTLTQLGKRPEPPRPLPPPPAWTSTRKATRISFDGHAVRHWLQWDPVAEASGFRVEMARDGAFRDLFVDRRVPSKVLKAEIENLEPGRYYVRVSSIDDRGLQGEGSQVGELVVVPVQTTRLEADKPGVFHAFWGAKLTPDTRLARLQVSVDGAETAAGMIELVGPGDYSISIGLMEDGFEPETFTLHIEAVEVQAAIDPERAPATGGNVAVRVRTLNSGGTPIPLEASWLRTIPPLIGPAHTAEDGATIGVIGLEKTDHPLSFPLHVLLRGASEPVRTLTVEQAGPLPSPAKVLLAARMGGGPQLATGALEGTVGAEVGFLFPAVRQRSLLAIEFDLTRMSPDGGEGDEGVRSPMSRLSFVVTPQYRRPLGAKLVGYGGGGLAVRIFQDAANEPGARVGLGLEALCGLEVPLRSTGVFAEVRYSYDPPTERRVVPGSVWAALGIRWMGGRRTRSLRE